MLPPPPPLPPRTLCIQLLIVSTCFQLFLFLKKSKSVYFQLVGYCPGDLKYHYFYNTYTLFFGLTVPSVIVTSIFYYKIFRKLQTTRIRGSRNSSLNLCFFLICLWWFLCNVPYTLVSAFFDLFPEFNNEWYQTVKKDRYRVLLIETSLLLTNSYSFVNLIILIACVRQFSQPLGKLATKIFGRLSSWASHVVILIDQTL